MYQPRLKELGYTDNDNISIEHYIELLHPHDRPAFEQAWGRFIQGDADYFDLSYRIRDENHHWQWYRDLGRVVERDKDGSISRISGTCTDVTHTRINEEKLRLFGEAFVIPVTGLSSLTMNSCPSPPIRLFVRHLASTRKPISACSCRVLSAMNSGFFIVG